MAIRDIHMPQCASLRDSIIGISDRFIPFTDKTSVRTFACVYTKPSYLSLIIGAFPSDVFQKKYLLGQFLTFVFVIVYSGPTWSSLLLAFFLGSGGHSSLGSSS